MLNKKKGNISGVSTQLNSSQGLVASQAGRKAGAHLPPGSRSSLAASQAGRCSPSSGEGSSLAASHAGRHSPSLWGRKQFSSFLGRQAGNNSGSCPPFQGQCFLPGRQQGHP